MRALGAFEAPVVVISRGREVPETWVSKSRGTFLGNPTIWGSILQAPVFAKPPDVQFPEA